MYTVKTPVIASLDIKKSQFIAHLIPYDAFDGYMKKLREDHPKGRHFVWAIRTLNEHGQIVENSSDDGEPKNTSGKPTLKVLQGHDLIECAIITVRYFGGIKLGTGGLVRAYNDAGQEAVEKAALIDTDSLNTLTVEIPYDMTRQTDYHIDRLGLTVIARDFSADRVTVKLQGESAKLAEIDSLLR